MVEKLNQELQSLRIDRAQKAAASPNAWKALGLFLIMLLLALVALVLFAPERIGLSGIAGRTHLVEVAVVETRPASSADIDLTASGYVVPRRRIEVSSKTSGRVVELLADRGDIVKVGQVLARLDDQEIRAQLNQARAGRQAAAARLEEATAGSRPQEIERAQAALEEAEASMGAAQVNLDRAVRLQERGVLAKQALDDARSAHDVASAQAKAARKSLELAKLGPRTEQIQMARAQLAEADASIVWWEAQLENTIIRAPVAGTVLERLIEKGEMVTTGFVSGRGAKSALVSIADLKDLEIEVDVNEADIPRVRAGQDCSVTPESYPDKKYPARVREIAPEANRQKGTIQIKVTVINPDEYLRPETSAKVNFLADAGKLPPTREHRIRVPKAALVQGPAVFLYRDGRAVRTVVSLGAERADRVEILSGLQGGETLVVSGLAGLADGMNLAIKK